MKWALIAGVAAFVWSQTAWIGAAAAGAAYLAHVWVFPYAKCVYCGTRGGPRRVDSSGAVWHDCMWCGGSGKRRRVLSHVIGGWNV